MTNRKRVLSLVIFSAILITTSLLIVSKYFISNPQVARARIEAVRVHYPEIFVMARNIAMATAGEKTQTELAKALPFLKLNFSSNDLAHLSDLYTRYLSGGDGIDYYINNNIWRSASLDYEGEPYRIKFRSHGKFPDGHHEGRHYSLTIKLLGGKIINNTNRFNLIVRTRIKPIQQLALAFADKMGLIYQPQKMVVVKINGWQEKIYFFEQRLNNKYMEVSNRPSFIRLESTDDSTQDSDKSLIYTTGSNVYSNAEYSKLLKAAMSNEGIDPLKNKPLQDRYNHLNQQILALNSENIAAYFDLDYISKYEALRLISGFTDHGWAKDNFHIFLDKASGKFYPTVTNDDNAAYLGNPGLDPIEKQINHFKRGELIVNYSLFIALSKNNEIRQKKYEVIHNIINNYNDVYLDDLREIIQLNNSVYTYGYLWFLIDSLNYLKKELYENNLSVLKEYLSTSSPVLARSTTKGSMTLYLQPNSMSKLGLSKFTFRTPYLNKEFKLKTQILGISNGEQQSFEVVNGNVNSDIKGNIDLSDFFKAIEFYDTLDNDSSRAQVTYKITLESDAIEPRPVTSEHFDIEIKNLITNQVINIDEISQESVTNKLRINHKKSKFETKEIKTDLILNMIDGIDYEIKNGSEMIIKSGDYKILDDLIIPEHLSLTINKGVTLRMREGVSLICKNKVYIDGTREFPVKIIPLEEGKPFGTVAIIGNRSHETIINHLNLVGGSAKSYEGILFSGGLSIHYHGKVQIMNSNFTESNADDGVNLKYIHKIIIASSNFIDNVVDQVDIDNSNAFISDSYFQTTLNHHNSDGIDFSGSNAIISNSSFIGFADKGISVGEKSTVYAFDNKVTNNRIGIASKDSSVVFSENNKFLDNDIDFAAYMKKAHFGASRVLIQKSDINPKNSLRLTSGRYSGYYTFDDILDKSKLDFGSDINVILKPLTHPQMDNLNSEEINFD